MRLRDLITAYQQEKEQWPESPNALLDFCQYKYNRGELEAEDYRKLFSKLHNEGATSAYQLH
ncbi:YppF family protein [Salinibacillus xinjiangensis]|uniref:YppF family protein n=1 Tax=Salinibacillus xinjiangensis TaxID=1229268 RepID=UPI00129B84C6|nr:YppF family protein [Salinibacillus xinjiangensis]